MSDPESIEENSLNTESEKKVTKRRSSVFKRRSVLSPPKDLENIDVPDEIVQEYKKVKRNKDSKVEFELTKYIDSLKEEDKKWREEYAKRKSRLKERTKRYKVLEKIGQKLDLTLLSDSQRAFLAEQPDYDDLDKNYNQLHKMAVKTTYLNLRCTNMTEKLMLRLQSDTENLKHEIMKLSE